MNGLYSVEHGVLLTREILGDRRQVLEPIRIPAEHFEASVLTTLPEEKSMAYNLEGRLGVQIINGANEKAVISAPAWGGSFESPITNLENQNLAARLGDTAVVSYNMPGHGTQFSSLPWRREARQGLRRGSFLAAGGQIGDLLKSRTNPYDHLDVVGFSTGGRAALGIAGKVGHVTNMVVFDPPGSEKMSYKEFASRYKKIEGEHSLGYRTASRDEELQQLIDQSPRHKRKGIGQNISNGSLIDYYYREPAALARGGLREDLRKTNFHRISRFVFISPEQSALNRPDTVKHILELTAQENRGTRFEHWRFAGTHAFSRIGASAVAQLYKVALTA